MAWVAPVRPGFVWVAATAVVVTAAASSQQGDPENVTPGYYVPEKPEPEPGYVYVQGFWVGENYIEGYYRLESRPGDTWMWMDGVYLEDGTYQWGTWVPRKQPPEGFVWEPGFFDGKTWNDGFYRPMERAGYEWVPALYNDDGGFNTGYWAPTEDKSGQTWVPGWFDGKTWVQGYWVTEAEARNADPEDWSPGASDPQAERYPEDTPNNEPDDSQDLQPIAIPVDVD